jgi:hypothetical protein
VTGWLVPSTGQSEDPSTAWLVPSTAEDPRLLKTEGFGRHVRELKIQRKNPGNALLYEKHLSISLWTFLSKIFGAWKPVTPGKI